MSLTAGAKGPGGLEKGPVPASHSPAVRELWGGDGRATGTTWPPKSQKGQAPPLPRCRVGPCTEVPRDPSGQAWCGSSGLTPAHLVVMGDYRDLSQSVLGLGRGVGFSIRKHGMILELVRGEEAGQYPSRENCGWVSTACGADGLGPGWLGFLRDVGY